jgi:hypothetical protein
MDEIELWHFSIRVRALECFFTKEEILRQFNSQGKKNIVRLILSHYKHVEGVTSSNDVPAILALIMYHSNYSPLVAYCENNDINVRDTTFLIETHQESDIIALAESFIY